MALRDMNALKIAAPALALVAGSYALAGCTPEYDGWTGCEQAEILPGVGNPRPSINARLIELNDNNEDLVYDSTKFAAGTNQDAMSALFSIYKQRFGEDRVEIQAGDEIPFCVTKDGVKSFDLGGTIVVQGKDYTFADKDWLLITDAKK